MSEHDDDEAIEIPKIRTIPAELAYFRFPPGEDPELVVVAGGQATATRVRRETMWRLVLDGIRALEHEELRARAWQKQRAKLEERAASARPGKPDPGTT